MAGRLNGKTAIVTGGASGIGASTARIFAREGAKVVVTDVQDSKGEAVAKEIGGIYLHQDTGDEAQWTRTIEATLAKHGQLDVLMNNAGVFIGANIEETTLELWNKVLGVNLTGVMLGC
ncbi:MAG: SDR family NAD(P)-dependent oxidoreductase, partial [Rhizomicrobium sp.]